jgi:cellulose synthase (UDP-forming)
VTTQQGQAVGPAFRTRRRANLRLVLIRILVVLVLSLGVNYLAWRWLESVNWSAWPIAIPLILAETYSFLDACLFGLTMWRLRERPAAPPPAEGATVDIFITTYNEPVEMVMATALAAQAIRWPHETWILDDGAREEMKAAADEAGIGYITRSQDWADKPRHAKAGNLNNALFQTSGEFLLILDADQVPSADILHRTLGWFEDPSVALVQTPQWFHNVDEADVFGSQAPLFYGPIQQGKDGWNAAFFCGSNAILRREALMQIGVVGYVREVQRAVHDALRTARRMLARARRTAQAQGPAAIAAVDAVQRAATQALAELRAGEPVAEVTYRFQQAADRASREMVASDAVAWAADLAAIQELPFESDREVDGVVVDAAALDRLAGREWSPLGALESVKALVDAVDVLRSDEAQPVMPMATISVTEDMATAMRLHSAGWHTVYHHEILARGLAPEDMGSMLHQRLRWAQGTLQVMLRENPLVQRGLSAGQRLMYFATMWSYLSGFAAIAYIAAPISYLVFGILPVTTLGSDFMLRLIPFLIANQLLFLVIGWRVKTWRGQQYSLALFPLWIRACTTAVANVWFGRALGFVVTPKTRQSDESVPWRLVRPQVIAMALLVIAGVVGLLRWSQDALNGVPTAVNLIWIVYDIVVLSIVVRAVRHRDDQEDAQSTTAPSRAAGIRTLLPPSLVSAGRRPVLLGTMALLVSISLAASLLTLVRQDADPERDTATAAPSADADDSMLQAGADTPGPPAEAPSTGSYVQARVTAGGDVRVRQWIQSRKPMASVALELPELPDSSRSVRATDVLVAADRVVLAEQRPIEASTRRLDLPDPAKLLYVRYTLKGVVERSPSAPGRALAHATALQVQPSPGPSHLSVRSQDVLTASCAADQTSLPRPCGAPSDDGWTVVLRGDQRRDSVVAQVNL